MKGLGRRTPTDFEHVEKFPLTAITPPVGVPVAIGVDWYRNFDRPQKDGQRYWIGRGDLGSIRGGHCVCIRSRQADLKSWWQFYDQGSEGACVGFGCSRMMSLLNRTRYEARWLWDRAKEVDEWPDTNPGDNHGTSVRAALSQLMVLGHVTTRRGPAGQPSTLEGIEEYRWARTVDEVLTVIDVPLAVKLGAVPILNSWGTDYPHTVWMPGETLQRLLDQDGEAGLVTDR